MLYLFHVKIDKFVSGLIVIVFLAWLFPYPAGGVSGLILGHISTIGVFLIFFFYGLRLSYEKIKTGLKNWRLHFLVQTTTFLLFPLVVMVLYPFIRNEQQEIIWLGLFFMSVVPSTVSSSVIMVSIGKGNIPAAIFNASISGIIGIIFTPLWMGLFIHNAQPGFDFTEIYFRLFIGIILPVIIGVLMQRKGYSFALKHRKGLSIFDRSVILLIVYKSFAGSFNDAVFDSINIFVFSGLTIIVIILFFILYGVVYAISEVLKLNRADKITALFCGLQKSLVHGTVFASVIFSGYQAAGLILLPLMLFHSLQIFVISLIAARYGRKYKE